jgi:MATE family multidrug resistance protein
MGAARPKKRNKTIKYCLIWGLGIGVVFSLIYGVFNVSILKIFTSQPRVMKTALAFFGWTIAAPFVTSPSYIWDGIFIGATETAPMRNSMIIATFLVFLPAYFAVQPFWGNNGLWLAMLLFMASRGIILTIFSPKYILKKRFREILN